VTTRLNIVFKVFRIMLRVSYHYPLMTWEMM